MPFSLLPKMIVPSVTDLSAELLSEHGIELLMLDFDNTLVPYTTDIPEPAVVNWLDSLKAHGVKMCVVSNSRKNRVRVFCGNYNLKCITHSRKPFPKGIRQCLQTYNAAPERCALAGDQIFTDTLGANCMGVRSILVTPIHNHNFWLKARHVLEKPFIFAARKRRVGLSK